MAEFFVGWWSSSPWTLLSICVALAGLGFAVVKHFVLDPGVRKRQAARNEVYPLLLEDFSKISAGIQFWDIPKDTAYNRLTQSGKILLAPAALQAHLATGYSRLTEFQALLHTAQAEYRATCQRIVSNIRTPEDDIEFANKRWSGRPAMGSPMYDLRWFVRGYDVPKIPDREYLLFDSSYDPWDLKVTVYDLRRWNLTEEDMASRIKAELRPRAWFNRLGQLEKEIVTEFSSLAAEVRQLMGKV